MSDVKEIYEKLSKKYNLPAYVDINREFELDDIEEHFVLKNCLRKGAEKLEFYMGILNDILQPDTGSLSSMHETRFFNNDERQQMFLLFKRMMKAHRSIIFTLLVNDEKGQAACLKTIFSEWIAMKKELSPIVNTMKETWDKDTTIQEEVRYFG